VLEHFDGEIKRHNRRQVGQFHGDAPRARSKFEDGLRLVAHNDIPPKLQVVPLVGLIFIKWQDIVIVRLHCLKGMIPHGDSP
jgi:hypothetical protein